MSANPSRLGLELSVIAEHNVQRAFRQSYNLIETEQRKLKELNPQNPLLGLVYLDSSHEGCSFADGFKARVVEHMAADLQDPQVCNCNLYYLLGAYIELLREEQINPKFLPAQHFSF